MGLTHKLEYMDVAERKFSYLREVFRFSWADAKRTLHYWSQTEVHVFSFSIAANVLLSFYPFMLVMIALCRQFLRWPAAEEAIYTAIRDYFPGSTGAFLARNLPVDYAGSVRQLEWVSLLLLLFTANGIFMPLEVALNRAWAVAENRPFWKNQVVSMALILGCGALAVLSTTFTAMNQELFASALGDWPQVLKYLGVGAFKIASLPITILILFLIYWLLPNAGVPPKLILPGAIRVGVGLEALKWINLLIWPWVHAKLNREYGVFVNSATILIWSFMAGMVVLAGADASARRARILHTGIDPDAQLPLGPGARWLT